MPRLPTLVAGMLLAASPERATAGGPQPAPDLAPETKNRITSPHDVNIAGISFKPGKGLAIASEDGEFRLETRLRVQLLATAAAVDSSSTESGLMIRRARLQFVGNTFGKHNKFKVELAFSPRDLRMTELGSNTIVRESPLLTWYVEFDHLRDVTVRAGQYKIPFSRQRVISSGNLQMVDRALANGEFNLDRDIGIDVRSKDLFGLDLFRYYIGVYNGEGRSAFENGDQRLLYLGRVEVLPFGMFADYSEGDHQRLARPGLSIALAYAYARGAGGTLLNRGPTPADGGTTNVKTLTADATFKFAGLSLSGELFWRDGTRNAGNNVDENGVLIPVEPARNGVGWFTQLGYLLPERPLEAAVRYGRVAPAGDSSLARRQETGLAVSYYAARHALKLQADLFRLWGDGAAGDATRGRIQLQVAF